MNKAFMGTEVLRLVRRKGSHYYFTGTGWTDNPELARTFADSLEAAQVCAQNGLKDVELAVRVRGGGTDLFCTSIL